MLWSKPPIKLLLLIAETGLVVSLGLTIYALLIIKATCIWCLMSLGLIVLLTIALTRWQRLVGDQDDYLSRLVNRRLSFVTPFLGRLVSVCTFLLCLAAAFHAGAMVGPPPIVALPSRSDLTEVRLADLPRLDEKSGRTLGDANAPLRLIEFYNPNCGYSARYTAESFDFIVDRFVETGKARYEVRLLASPGSPLALADACAAEQGRFFAYRSLTVKRHARTREELLQLASEAMIPDMDAFSKCMAQPETRAVIEADASLAMRHGINSTPTLVAGGRIMRGKRSNEQYDHLISSLLAADSAAR